MGSKRNTVMIVVGVIVGILFVLSVVLLWSGWSGYAKADAGLRASKGTLEQLYTRDPFPSEENVRDERKNVVVLNEEFARLVTTLSEGQVESDEQSPTRLMSRFWETQKALLTRAKEAGITVPENFHFGFPSFLDGKVPAPSDATTLPRLSQQLEIIRELSAALFDAQITELRGMGREEFEKPKDAAAGGPAAAPVFRVQNRTGAGAALTQNMENPDAGLIQGDALYGKWRFALDFTAKEGALASVLNRLAKHHLFVVVTRLDLEGENQGPVVKERRALQGEAEAGKESAARELVQRDLRILYGVENPMAVRLELEVYRFPKPVAASTHKQAEG